VKFHERGALGMAQNSQNGQEAMTREVKEKEWRQSTNTRDVVGGPFQKKAGEFLAVMVGSQAAEAQKMLLGGGG